MVCRKLTAPSLSKVFILLMVQAFLLYIFLQFSSKFDIERMNGGASQQSAVYINEKAAPPAITSIMSASDRRVTLVRKFCNKHKKEVTSTYPFFLDYSFTLLNWVWMVSTHHHLFYCATPKCGSTTWKSYIMEDLKINWTGLDTHQAATGHISSATIFEERNQTIMEYLETYRPNHRIIFVRNPWARLASAYDDKILDKKWKLRNLCMGWQPFEHVQNVTFQQFIECLLERPQSILYQPHTHPISALCAVCHMDYNVILTVEELDEAKSYLMKTLNFTVTPEYNPPRRLKNNEYSAKYKNVSKDHLHQLQQVYKYDIQLFGFPKSPFD